LASVAPLCMELRRSLPLAMLIVAVHLFAAACLLTLMTGWQAFLLALLVTTLGFFTAANRALLKGRQAACRIEIGGDSTGATLVFADGRTATVAAVRGVGITRHWVALQTCGPLGRSFLVVAGMLPEATFRLLRLWALWGKVPGVASGQRPG